MRVHMSADRMINENHGRPSLKARSQPAVARREAAHEAKHAVGAWALTLRKLSCHAKVQVASGRQSQATWSPAKPRQAKAWQSSGACCGRAQMRGGRQENPQDVQCTGACTIPHQQSSNLKIGDREEELEDGKGVLRPPGTPTSVHQAPADCPCAEHGAGPQTGV